MNTAIRIGLGVLVLGHGLAHLVAIIDMLALRQDVFPAPDWMPRWLAIASALLSAVAGGALIAGAIGLFADSEWWQAAVVGGALVSLIVLGMWFRSLPVGGKLGVGFDVALIIGIALFG